MKAWTLNHQERISLSNRIQNDLFLGNQIPKHLEPFISGWEHNGALRVTAFGQSPQKALIWVFDQGAKFPEDWVRSSWAIHSQPRIDWALFAQSAHAHFCEQGSRYFRWSVAASISSRAQRIFESWGAIAIEWDKSDIVTYSLGLAHPNLPYRTRSNYVISNPRIEDFHSLQDWLADNELESAIAIRRLLKRRTIKENLYNPIVGASYCAPFSILPIRKNEELLGFAVEHSWDFKFDGFREFDIALPGLTQKSFRTVPDLYSSLIDRAFRRGATRVLTASRIGSSQKGYPNLYRHLGGTDVTQAVLGFGLGDTERRYYATYRNTFYESRLGKPFLDHHPYKEII